MICPDDLVPPLPVLGQAVCADGEVPCRRAGCLEGWNGRTPFCTLTPQPQWVAGAGSSGDLLTPIYRGFEVHQPENRGAPGSHLDPTDVSVVIPTRNRPHLITRAVQSVLAQTTPPGEIVVVIDGPDEATARVLEGIADPRLKAKQLERNGGPGRARNIGVRASTRTWVAFLDDDDEWKPRKLESQCRLVHEPLGRPLVLATGVELRSGETTYWWPRRVPATSEPIADYLFVRRQPGEGYLAIPTIMLPRQFALANPIPEHLLNHEDWDWYIGLEKSGAEFIVVPEALVIVHDPPARVSASHGSKWEDSLGWILTRKDDVSPEAFSDFCLTEVARAARRQRSLKLYFSIFFLAWTGHITRLSLVRFLAIMIFPAEVRARLSGARRFSSSSQRGTASGRVAAS